MTTNPLIANLEYVVAAAFEADARVIAAAEAAAANYILNIYPTATALSVENASFDADIVRPVAIFDGDGNALWAASDTTPEATAIRVDLDDIVRHLGRSYDYINNYITEIELS